MQHKRPDGRTLLLPYTPGGSGQVFLSGAVYVHAGKDAWEVSVHPRDFALGQPRWPDGSLTNTAKLYAWFGQEF